ncbi:MAG: DUF1385 domain-containing protein [Clostridiaceae bacterium]|jgi:uncharacterized protein YqhQ|nr:DUF1385 domain-containing protein [Clostridiaceae bacterium]
MKKNEIDQQDPEATSCRRKTTIGGQALIEGLMMIGPEKKAMAVRLADGTIAVEAMPMVAFSGLANWPFVRGGIRLFRQLVSGTKALLRSAELADDETQPEQSPEAKPGKIGQRIDAFLGRHPQLMLYGSATVGILFSVALFILLPNLLTSGISQLTGLGREGASRGTTVLLNLIEGLIRIGLFIGYLALANRMKEIQRVWMYHGAEHKTIACYEAQQPMTVDNARAFSRFHPRCGTAFLFLVILISIIIFTLVGWWGRWLNLLIRFALVPLVAGIAYEIIRLAGRYDNALTRAISTPGLWLQRLTTAEPDDSMLEVAIAALDAVRPMRIDSDRW